MARKESTVVIKAPGRDKDKVFVITEVSSAQAEDWALRVFLALARGGVEVPENIASAGLAGVVALGIKALGSVRHEDAALLMQEMMDCVQIIPDPLKMEVKRRLLSDDIEEVATRFQLREEVVSLHTGFSLAAARLKSAAATASKSPSSSIETSLAQ